MCLNGLEALKYLLFYTKQSTVVAKKSVVLKKKARDNTKRYSTRYCENCG